MRVKVGGIIFDSNEQPIVVELSEKDKENIANMAPDATKYCCYPETDPDGLEYNPETILEFMKKM